MSEIVFVLGAGASKGAGAPVMADFLDKSLELLKLNEVGDYAEDFDRVFYARSKLQIIHSKSDFDISNLESVFAAFEMGRVINKLPEIEGEGIENLLVSMRKLIQVTLERTISYPIENKSVLPPKAYHNFALMIDELLKNGHQVSIITFNYDYALDFALHEVNIPADYCLPNQESGERRVTPLFKLHGSLNWVKCPDCGHIYPVSIGKFLANSNIGLIIHSNVIKETHFDFSSLLEKQKCQQCDTPMNPNPAIVPPSWNKTEYQQSISAVWSRAAQELSNAENIFVSGYALNESDLFFRYLFALGAVGEELIQRFWVFNTENERGVVDQRFQQMIGTAIINKYRYFSEPFSNVSGAVRKEFIR